MRKIALEADKFRLYFKKGTIPPRKSADFRFESPLGWIGSGGQPNALPNAKMLLDAYCPLLARAIATAESNRSGLSFMRTQADRHRLTIDGLSEDARSFRQDVYVSSRLSGGSLNSMRTSGGLYCSEKDMGQDAGLDCSDQDFDRQSSACLPGWRCMYSEQM